MKIAVVGTGIAGISAAYSLSKKHDVTVFEADDRIGGHTHTINVPDGFGNEIAVDTGFIVYNDLNYPNLIRFFEELGVETQESDMSFGVSIGHGDYEYFGDFTGMFAQKRNILRPSHWMMIRDLLNFYKNAPTMHKHAQENQLSIKQLLDEKNYSRAFRYRHILPMAGAIWSMPVERVNEFPAESLISFFVNHKLFDLDLMARPVWRTVTNGSHSYVKIARKAFDEKLHLRAPIQTAQRNAEGVLLTIGGVNQRQEQFDEVVFACHPDQTLEILGADASSEERHILSGIQYEDNIAVVHSDLNHMPKRQRAWASWNYMAKNEAHNDETLSPVALTYWMNKLQNLQTKDPLLVTLNPLEMPAQDKTYKTVKYAHPQFSREALNSQKSLRSIQGANKLWYCGAWTGHGFHEDGASSGFAVAKALGAPTAWAETITEMSPAGENATPVKAYSSLAAE